MNIIDIDNLSIFIEKKSIITKCSYSFKSKKMYVIFGKSGSGKSTFLKALPNLICHDGKISLNDLDICTMSPLLVRKKVHYLHQEPVLFTGTVEENLKLPFGLKYNTKLVYSRNDTIKFLQMTGLGQDILDVNAENLSGGEKQKICLVRALILKPDFLLLDEPSSALDIVSEGQLIMMLQQIAKSIGVIVVSHSARIIQSADIALLLENKRLNQVVEELTLERIYSLLGDEFTNA